MNKLSVVFILFTTVLLHSCSSKKIIDSLDTLEISTTEKVSDSIQTLIESSLEHGFIPGINKHFQEAIVNGSPAKFKLKGDHLDHCNSEKTSYKISLENPFQDQVYFAIQHPRTREYMEEYVFHKWAQKEDIIAPHYNFINVVENKEPKGVYAIEGAIDWRRLATYNRIKSPILYFNEDGYFEHLSQWRKEQDIHPPFIQSTTISCFNKADVLADSTLLKYYYRAKELLFAYQWDLLPADSIFDIDNAAKYYALISLHRGFHGIVWHNQRFYYNPEKDRLEHVAYDVSNPDGKKWGGLGLFGYFSRDHNNPKHNTMAYHINLLRDSTFRTKLCNYAEVFSKKAYLDGVFNAFDDDIKTIEEAFQHEYEYYQFPKEGIYNHAKKLKHLVKEFRKIKDNKIYFNRMNAFKYRDYTGQYGHPYPSILVKAFQNEGEVEVFNFMEGDIEIEGAIIKGFNQNGLPNSFVTQEELDNISFNFEGVEYSIPVDKESFVGLN